MRRAEGPVGPWFEVRLRLLATSDGGRAQPIWNGYRPNWNLGRSWLGVPSLEGGTVVLPDGQALAPGAERSARIAPLVAERWGHVGVGTMIAMQEGGRVVGHAWVASVVGAPEGWCPEVAVFVDEARQFCACVEDVGRVPRDRRLAAFVPRLLGLYAAALRLPAVDPPDGIEAGPPQGPAARPDLGDRDGYWEVYDPYEHGAPVLGSLADDVRDIYLDLRRGLALWEAAAASGDARFGAAAVWEWRFAFEAHWGKHAVDALRALHHAGS